MDHPGRVFDRAGFDHGDDDVEGVLVVIGQKAHGDAERGHWPAHAGSADDLPTALRRRSEQSEDCTAHPGPATARTPLPRLDQPEIDVPALVVLALLMGGCL